MKNGRETGRFCLSSTLHSTQVIVEIIVFLGVLLHTLFFDLLHFSYHLIQIKELLYEHAVACGYRSVETHSDRYLDVQKIVKP